MALGIVIVSCDGTNSTPADGGTGGAGHGGTIGRTTDSGVAGSGGTLDGGGADGGGAGSAGGSDGGFAKDMAESANVVSDASTDSFSEAKDGSLVGCMADGGNPLRADFPDGGGAEFCQMQTCAPGSYCAYVVWNGQVSVRQCVALPCGCDACGCAEAQLAVAYSAKFPGGGLPSCVCGAGPHQLSVDAGSDATLVITCEGL
jgi:hypothetical protein